MAYWQPVSLDRCSLRSRNSPLHWHPLHWLWQSTCIPFSTRSTVRLGCQCQSTVVHPGQCPFSVAFHCLMHFKQNIPSQHDISWASTSSWWHERQYNQSLGLQRKMCAFALYHSVTWSSTMLSGKHPFSPRNVPSDHPGFEGKLLTSVMMSPGVKRNSCSLSPAKLYFTKASAEVHNSSSVNSDEEHRHNAR